MNNIDMKIPRLNGEWDIKRYKKHSKELLQVIKNQQKQIEIANAKEDEIIKKIKIEIDEIKTGLTFNNGTQNGLMRALEIIKKVCK